MKRLGDRDAQRSWGPQSTAIPVGGTIAWMLGAGALLFGVACEVPEVQMWATIALPASITISIAYVLVRRWRDRPPTTLQLDAFGEPDQVASESVPPHTRVHLQDAVA